MNRWISSAAVTALVAAAAFCLRIPDCHGGGASERTEPKRSDISVVTVAQKSPQRPQAALPPLPSPPSEQAVPVAAPAGQPAVEEQDSAAEENAADDSGGGAPSFDGGIDDGDAPLSDEAAAQAERYRRYALGRISSKKSYPVQARAKGVEGRVRVRLEILPDGSVASVSIIEGSGSPLLDEACLSAVRKSAPFKKMPPAASPLTLVFAMDFTLD